MIDLSVCEGMTVEQKEAIEAAYKESELHWRSNIQDAVDQLKRDIAELKAVGEDVKNQLSELNSLLAIGKGGVALTFFMAKIIAAIGVIGGGLYALKAWILKV